MKARQGRSQSGRQSSIGPSIIASQAPSVEWLRRGNISKVSRLRTGVSSVSTAMGGQTFPGNRRPTRKH